MTKNTISSSTTTPSSDAKKMGRENSREGNLREAGGGIPRPSAAGGSPSKLAVRTTNKLLGMEN